MQHDETVDEAVTFLSALRDSAEWQQQLERSVSERPGVLDVVTRFAADRGYSFSAESLLSAREAMTSVSLADADLDGVSGGFNPQPDPPALVNPLMKQRPFLKWIATW